MTPTEMIPVPDVVSSLLNTDDVPSTGINGITTTTSSNKNNDDDDDDDDDVIKMIDDHDAILSGGDVSVVPSPVSETIHLAKVEEEEEEVPSSDKAAVNGSIMTTDIIITDLDDLDVDFAKLVTDDHYTEEEDDELSVTFSPVWEEIVIQQPSATTTTTTTTTLAMVQESSSSRLVLPERVMGFPSSRSSSSFSSTEIPFQGSYHSSRHSNLLPSRSRMMEDSRSLDSMTVMYDPTNRNRNLHPNSNVDIDSSNTGVVPTIVAFGSRSTDVDDPNPDQLPSRVTGLRYYRRILCWSLRLIFFPIWLLVSVFTVSTVIAFCILPGILILSIMISCYYCCSRDPIPFNVLIQAMLLDDVNNNNSENMNAPARTKDEIRELLICRTCTKAEPRRHSKYDDDAVIDKVPDTHQPDREEIVSRGPVYVATDNYYLMFSDQILFNQSNDGEEKDQPDEENAVPPRLSLPSNAVENNYAESSVDAVHALSTAGHYGDEDDGEVHSDSQLTRNDIEQGRHSVIEMTTMTRAATICDPLDAFASTELKNRGKTLDIESSHNHDDEEDDDYFESGIGCDICLRRYQQNDIVAWSHNEQCIHAYHLHCITDWLQKKISCPNCRCRYISKHKDNQQHKRNAPPTQDRIVLNNDDTNNNSSNRNRAASRTAHNNNRHNDTSNSTGSTAARTTAILYHQRSVTTLYP